ncbi:hypothetical protein ABPG75_002837 [Micractinium tetrahymenae]
MLSVVLNGAMQVRETLGAEPGPDSALQGVCAAHWAALQAAVAVCTTDLPQLVAGNGGGRDAFLRSVGEMLVSQTFARDSLAGMEVLGFAAGLSQLAVTGPAAVARSPELLSMLGQSLHLVVPNVPEYMYASWFDMVFCRAKPEPRLAACLVASGSLAAVADGMPADKALAQSGWRLLQRCAELLAVVQAAAAAEPAALAVQESCGPGASQAAQDLDAAIGELLRRFGTAVATQGKLAQLRATLLRALPGAAQVAAALQVDWQVQDAAPERRQVAQLELAQAAATRTSCAHLACPNVGATGRRGKLCTGCRVARYCSRACSVADWQAGHRVACRLLAAAREAEAAAGAVEAE